MDQKMSEEDNFVFTDATSSVTTGEIKNRTVKSLTFHVETESQPGSASANAVQQVPQAGIVALGGSTICAYNIIGAEIGDLNFSVCVGQPARAGPEKEELQPEKEELPEEQVPQGPAEKMITEHKVKITKCLMAERHYILQHMQQEDVITKRKYRKLMEISKPEESIIDLIDHMLDNGEKSCSQFLEVLRKPDVLKTFPKLIEITKNWP